MFLHVEAELDRITLRRAVKPATIPAWEPHAVPPSTSAPRSTLRESAPPSQRHEKECLKLVQAKGWQVVETYTDNSVSSKEGVARPSYDRMMADYRAGRFDAIVC